MCPNLQRTDIKERDHQPAFAISYSSAAAEKRSRLQIQTFDSGAQQKLVITTVSLSIFCLELFK